ncbi:mycofactocin-coupled SDR family oxidoreductase [Pseudonocardia oceani]|nr:mycofactocin-coupled SDR family oxidoreductase [Pseudonocardia oceani]
MGRVSGKVAFISGIGRGQGRSHAVRLAREGADIIGFDVCSDVDTVLYPMSTPDDLAETVSLVEKEDRRIIAEQADVRDYARVKEVLDRGFAEFGQVDIVVPNAGIVSYNPVWEWTEEQFRAVIDVNLIGVWNVVKAALPKVIEGGRGGSVVFTSSAAGVKAFPNTGAYTAAKHGVIGLMRLVAVEGAPHSIRSNAICPTNVRTGMIENDQTTKLFMPDKPDATLDDAYDAFLSMNMLPVPWIEASDISDTVLFLASDESKYITSVVLPVDAGCVEKLAAG